MNKKKILTAVCSVVLSCSVGITCFTGCTDSCEHVYTWTTEKEATCSSEGSRVGVCGICSDVITEIIPIDPEAHAYGEWQVSAPTQTAAGTATLTCTLNSAHTVTAELPALTDGAYTVSEITPATVTKGGESEYTYAHEKGDIVFRVQTPVKPVSSMQDVIDYAASKADEISKAAGNTEIPLGGGQSASKFYYEFGENYTHVYSDGDEREFYCTPDESSEQGAYVIEISGVKYSLDGNGYPVEKIKKGGAPFQNTGVNANYLNGFMFALGYTGISGMYGAEGVLTELYKNASANVNNDFTETPFASMKQSDGTYAGSFSFGFYSDSNHRFSIISVNFTLYDTWSIKTLNVESKIYGYDADTNQYGFVGYDAEGNELDFINFDNNPDTDLPPLPPVVRCAVKPDGIPVGVEKIQIAQERTQDVQTPVAENPYPRNALLVSSFNVRHSGNKLVGEEPVEVSAGEAKVFTVTDVVNVADVGKPDNAADRISNISYDPVTAYLREGDKDTVISASTGTDSAIRVSAVINRTSVTVRCFRLGNITVVLKTQSGNFEKVINISVGNAKGPSRLEPQVNVYYDTGYEWQPYSDVITADEPYVTVYAGQTLEFTAQAPETEQSYTDASYTAAITSSNAANADIFDNNKFISSVAGEYEILLTADVANSNGTRVKSLMTVKVVEAPSLSTLFGAYTANITDPEVTKATVTFSSPEPAKQHDDETNTDIDVYKGTVTVSFLGGTETLSYTYIPASVTAGENGVRKYNLPVLTTAYYSGAADLGCSLSINDAYGITLRHPREVAGQYEEVVLVPASN